MVPILFHIRRKLDAARAEARKAGGSAGAAVEQTHRIYGYRLLLTGALDSTLTTGAIATCGR